MQIAAQRDDGWTAQLSIKSSEDFTVQPPDLDSTGRYTTTCNRLRDAQFTQCSNRIRREKQSESQFTRICGAFMYGDFPAPPPQGNTGRQAADPGSDD